MAGTTRTILFTSGTNAQLNPKGYVVEIYDVFVSSSGLNVAWMAFNEGNAVSTHPKLYISTPESGANYTLVSSTNMYNMSEGIKFEGGCYVQTGPGFGYASITYGLEMA